MRKTWVFFIMILLLLSCVGLGLAETKLTFDTIYAECTLDDSKYILLTRNNLDMHQEWMANRGMNNESLLADWDARGVLAQAWSTANDACMEFTAVQDETSNTFFDLDAQTPAIRSKYRSGHLNGSLYGDDGYKYQSAEWKKTNQYGRFLMLKYKRTVNDTVYRGFARRAVRNGYTITVDYKVYGRALKNADLNALNKLMSTWHFTQVLTQNGSPQTVSESSSNTDSGSHIQFSSTITSEPPSETNTGKFKVKGTCNSGLHIIAVVMRMSGNEPIRMETDASKKGAFTFNVELPQEGTWLMTLTYLDGENTVGETVFGTTTYKQTLLPVNFDPVIPEQFTEDKFVIKGITDRNTTIQCLVSGSFSMNKQVRTNNSGAFSFKLDTSMEGNYSITLTFQKKGLDERRFSWNVNRTMSEQEKIEKTKSAAIKPAYTNLTAKLKNYVGRIMTYNLYITEVTQSGDEWIVFAAMQSTKNGYRNMVVLTCDQDPKFEIDSTHRIYGRLIGNYEILDAENGTTYYPCFELLLVDDQD